MRTPILEPQVAAAGSVFQRVLVAVDLSMASHRALGVALELRRTMESSVCLFGLAHSDGTDEFLGGIGSPAIGGDWIAETEARLARFVDNVAPAYAHRLQYRARIGDDPVSAIRDVVNEWHASFVIVVRGGRRRMFRTAAEKIAGSLDVPVLVM